MSGTEAPSQTGCVPGAVEWFVFPFKEVDKIKTHMNSWSVEGAAGPGSVAVELPRGGFVAVKTIKKPEDGEPIWSSYPDQYIDVDATHESNEPFKLTQ